MQKHSLFLFLCCSLITKVYTADPAETDDSQEQSLTIEYSQELEGSQDPDRNSKVTFNQKTKIKEVHSPRHLKQMEIMHSRPKELDRRRKNSAAKKARKKTPPKKIQMLDEEQMKQKNEGYKTRLINRIAILATIQKQGQKLTPHEESNFTDLQKQLALYNQTHQ